MCGSAPSQRKPVIGLAGGIGAGKSLVATVLAECGVGVIDSDALGRELMSEATVLQTLRAWWGDSVVDTEGRLDRRRIADIVFSDSARKAQLERLLHPLIAQRREALLEQLQADAKVAAIVLDSPLLFETGLDRRCEVVWFVEADVEVRLRRVVASRGWSAEELARREKLQESLECKRAKADYRIVNNSDIDDLRHQVVRLLRWGLERNPGVKS